MSPRPYDAVAGLGVEGAAEIPVWEEFKKPGVRSRKEERAALRRNSILDSGFWVPLNS